MGKKEIIRKKSNEIAISMQNSHLPVSPELAQGEGGERKGEREREREVITKQEQSLLKTRASQI